MKITTKNSSLEPVKKKTFKAVLSQFLAKECPQVGGELTRDLLAVKIEELFDKFFPETSRMKMGQMMWNAIDETEVSGYGKSIEKTKIKPVCLNLVDIRDIEAKLGGASKRNIRKEQVKRIFTQAKEQNGVLAYTDVAQMMGLSGSTIGKYVREMARTDGYRVPHRGLLHDMGPTVTHKKQICYKILVQGKSVEQVSKETKHSPEAITRYVTDYKRIYECLRNYFSIETTAYCTGKSKRLVQEYSTLIDSHKELIDKNLEDLDIF